MSAMPPKAEEMVAGTSGAICGHPFVNTIPDIASRIRATLARQPAFSAIRNAAAMARGEAIQPDLRREETAKASRCGHKPGSA